MWSKKDKNEEKKFQDEYANEENEDLSPKRKTYILYITGFSIFPLLFILLILLIVHIFIICA